MTEMRPMNDPEEGLVNYTYTTMWRPELLALVKQGDARAKTELARRAVKRDVRLAAFTQMENEEDK